MSENSEFEAPKQPATEPAPAGEADSGQYVDGDYGKAGIAREDETTAGEGEYPEGDFGAAGAVEEPARTVEGEYEAGDYGKAGTAGENLVTVEEAEYPDGDYGAAERALRVLRARARWVPPGAPRELRACLRSTGSSRMKCLWKTRPTKKTRISRATPPEGAR